MRIIGSDKPMTRDGLALALGYFDSVHQGHRRVFETANAYRDAHPGTRSAALTFRNNLSAAVKADAKEIYPYAERKSLIAACGIDYLLPLTFTPALKALSAAAFLDRLTAAVRVEAFVCGADYRFGQGRAGDVRFLRDYGAERGIAVVVTPKADRAGQKISTSGIKALLKAGDAAGAAALLHRPYTLTGRVVHGRGQGHLFGFPTANIAPPPEKFLPKEGVYACRVWIGKGRRTAYCAVANVGAKPTFGDPTPGVEALIDGFSGDLYGQTVTLSVLRYLRPIRVFDSPAALRAQIGRDMESAKSGAAL
jgi:riboflavin kinase/FMN adenylyltransferase